MSAGSPGTRDAWNAVIADPVVDAPPGRRLIVKDSIDVAGLPTRAGSPAVPARPAPSSAPIVQLLVDAGFTVIGKANMHELSFGVTSTNDWLGPVRNPHDRDRIPGGSSGGTAAALAAGLADAGLGGDTGGSLRIPAAFCGVVGFRASRSRYPREGALGLSPTRDVLGPMARTVAELEVLDRILCRRGLPIAPLPLAGLRVGVPRVPFYRDIDEPTSAAIEAVLATMGSSGCDLVPVDLGDLDDLQPLLDFPIAGFEIVQTLRSFAEQSGESLADFAARIAGRQVREVVTRLATGNGPGQAEYRAAMDRHRPALQALYRRTYAENRCVALVLPAVPVVAPLIGAETIDVAGMHRAVFEILTRNSWPASVADLPSLCMPAPASGLPVGLQIDGPTADDDRVIALGLALEAVFARPAQGTGQSPAAKD